MSVRQYVGGGWHVHHYTERVIELHKDDHAYRSLTGRDGVVRVRAEPGMDRAKMLDRALTLANQSDAALSQRIAHQFIPSARALREYRASSRTMARVFGTREEPEFIGRKRV